MIEQSFIPHSRSIRAAGAFLIACMLIMLGATAANAYDRTAFVNYNKTNALIYPTGYWNFSQYTNPWNRFGDSASFQSQALIAAGMDLTRGITELSPVSATYINKTYTGYYDDYGYLSRAQNPNGQITMPYCYDLINYLIDFEMFTYEGFTTNYPLLPYYEIGDLIYFQYSDETKTTLDGTYDCVTAIVGTTKDRLGQTIPLLAGHTPNKKGEPITSYFGPNNKYGFDYGFVMRQSTFAQRPITVEFNGGLNYYGLLALTVRINELGHEYLGYILNNSNRWDQDEVLAESTIGRPIGIYMMRGFCLSEHKGAPDQGCKFSQPWTSTSTSHWAYWVRKTVEYGVAHGATDLDMQHTVWYITDRYGSYSDYPILAAIGYPADGPQKNLSTDAQPGPVVSFTATNVTGGVKLDWKNPTDTDTRGVIITYRTDRTYPDDPTDGTVLISKVGAPGATDTFTHKAVTPGEVYNYAVWSYDEASNQSATSKTAQVRVPGGVWLSYRKNHAQNWELYN